MPCRPRFPHRSRDVANLSLSDCAQLLPSSALCHCWPLCSMDPSHSPRNRFFSLDSFCHSAFCQGDTPRYTHVLRIFKAIWNYSPMDPIIVRNLKKTYRWKGRVTEALRGVSFSVKKGEIFGLLGPNGAGKSTTTHILSGVLTKDAGDVRILGGAVSESAVRERMNVASAYFGMLDLLTVEENLRVAARLYRVQRPEDRIFELLQRFKIAHLAKAPFRSLSSGERTRVLLCKGPINIPEVLLLDECTVGLDPDIAELTRSIIADYQREHRTTILFTSHYMQEVEQLCNRI